MSTNTHSYFIFVLNLSTRLKTLTYPLQLNELNESMYLYILYKVIS